MPENMMNSAHKANSQLFNDNYHTVFPKSPEEVKMDTIARVTRKAEFEKRLGRLFPLMEEN